MIAIDSYAYSDNYLKIIKECLDIERDTNIMLESMNQSVYITESEEGYTRLDKLLNTVKKWFDKLYKRINTIINTACIELDNKTQSLRDKEMIDALNEFDSSKQVTVTNSAFSKDGIFIESIFRSANALKYYCNEIYNNVKKEISNFRSYANHASMSGVSLSNTQQYVFSLDRYQNILTDDAFVEYDSTKNQTVTFYSHEISRALSNKLPVNNIKEIQKTCEKTLKNSEKELNSILSVKDFDSKLYSTATQLVSLIEKNLIEIPRCIVVLYKREMSRRQFVRAAARQLLSESDGVG